MATTLPSLIILMWASYLVLVWKHISNIGQIYYNLVLSLEGGGGGYGSMDELLTNPLIYSTAFTQFTPVEEA